MTCVNELLCLFERREREQAEIQDLKAKRAELERDLGQLTGKIKNTERQKF